VLIQKANQFGKAGGNKMDNIRFEQLAQLRSITHDGDLISKSATEQLLNANYIIKCRGFNALNYQGISLLIDFGIISSNATARPVPPLRSAVQNAEEAAKTAANSAIAKLLDELDALVDTIGISMERGNKRAHEIIQQLRQ
jgi:hypothetical protein